jgi:DNA-binding NtrC family response regulator
MTTADLTIPTVAAAVALLPSALRDALEDWGAGNHFWVAGGAVRDADRVVRLPHLPGAIRGATPTTAVAGLECERVVAAVLDGSWTMEQACDTVRRAIVTGAIEAADGNLSVASARVGATRRIFTYQASRLGVRMERPRQPRAAEPTDPHAFKREMDAVAWGCILEALAAAEGNQQRAAAILGIKRTTLAAQIRRYAGRAVAHDAAA